MSSRKRPVSKRRFPNKTLRFKDDKESNVVQVENKASCTEIKDDQIASKPTTPNETPSVWENKILHYFLKVMNYLRATRKESMEEIQDTEKNVPNVIASQRKENAAQAFGRKNEDLREERVGRNIYQNMLPCPEKYCSINQSALIRRNEVTKQSIPDATTIQDINKPKEIVETALRYGLANHLLLKNGKYFWFNDVSPKACTPCSIKNDSRFSYSNCYDILDDPAEEEQFASEMCTTIYQNTNTMGSGSRKALHSSGKRKCPNAARSRSKRRKRCRKKSPATVRYECHRRKNAKVLKNISSSSSFFDL